MGKEEQLLSASIQDTLREAERASRALIRERKNHGFQDPGPEDDWSDDDAEGALDWWLNKAFRDTAILAERLGLPGFRADILAAKRRLSNLAGISPGSEDDFYCPGLSLASSLYDSLAVMTESGAVTGLSVLQTILQNTGKIIGDEQLVPKSEKEVRDAVSQKLSYAFNDLVREPTVAHPLKNYKPDFGVKSLMALIEFKYIRDAARVGTTLDELLIDMKGYTGHADWRNFFAVIYMANAYTTQDAVDAKFASVRADTIWKIILITASPP